MYNVGMPEAALSETETPIESCRWYSVTVVVSWRGECGVACLPRCHLVLLS